MGNPLSKSENKKNDDEYDISSNNILSSPISTPKPKYMHLDPRSPSESIARTPIQIMTNSNNNENDCTTPIIGVIHDDSTVIIDPRSPSVEFTRTPIITGGAVNNKNTSTVKIRNKNLDAVKQLTDCSPFKTPTGPKLISVSPFVARKPDEISMQQHHQEKRNSMGLLETNLDFTETNLDAITQQQHKEKLEKMCVITEALERISQIDKEIKEVIAITQDPIKLPDIDYVSPTQDFDKKVTNLIYEDQILDDDKTIEIKPAAIIMKEEARFALTERNVNHHNRQTSIQKLKVSDKPLMNKKDYTVSKIPVYKENLRNTKTNIVTQCENTPPSRKSGINLKSNKSQWDAEKTLII